MSKILQPDRTPQTAIQGVALQSKLDAIKALYDITSTCRGPEGKIKLLQNQLGGNLTITTSSRRLFSSLSVRNPVIKLLVSVAQGHLAAFRDGGLFLTNFAALLISKSVESGLKGRLLAEIFESFLSLSATYLQSSECLSKVKVSFSNIAFMNSVVKSVLRSKPLCGLNQSKMRHIAQLILECFINIAFDTSYSSCSMNHVFFLTVENVPVEDSKVFHGLLIPAPELSKFHKAKLSLIKGEGEHADKIVVAMVTVSMSGDMEELADRTFETEGNVDVEEQILEEVAKFCDHLVSLGVGLLLCQKVVHPQLKCRLRKAQVLVVDRVGLQPVQYLLNLTGAHPITRLCVPVEFDHLGSVDDVQHSILNNRSYLHLTREDNSVITFLLSHQEEQALNELKDVSSVALGTLDQLLQEPYLMMGGGCWQAELAQFLTQQVTVTSQHLCHELECSESTLMAACEVFSTSLVQSVLKQPSRYVVSSATGHVHRIKGNNSNESYTAGDVINLCGCQLCECVDDGVFLPVMSKSNHVKKSISSRRNSCNTPVKILEVLESREVILDSFVVCVNALQSAVLAASSVLRIGQMLENIV